MKPHTRAYKHAVPASTPRYPRRASLSSLDSSATSERDAIDRGRGRGRIDVRRERDDDARGVRDAGDGDDDAWEGDEGDGVMDRLIGQVRDGGVFCSQQQSAHDALCDKAASLRRGTTTEPGARGRSSRTASGTCLACAMTRTRAPKC